MYSMLHERDTFLPSPHLKNYNEEEKKHPQGNQLLEH